MVFQIYPLFLKLEPGCLRCAFNYLSRLWFPAPYTPVKKSIVKTGPDEVELSCESQGFPSAQVIWSDGQNTNLTEMSNSIIRSTDEDLIHIISKLTVKRDLVNNYSCSFLVKGVICQTDTFSIPGESHWCRKALLTSIRTLYHLLSNGSAVFISSHSDGTHSLQSIHCWDTDGI